MSSAHIFYIPIMIFVGVIAGFYLGRRAAEDEARELKKRRERRQALRDKQAALGGQDGAGAPAEADDADDAESEAS